MNKNHFFIIGFGIFVICLFSLSNNSVLPVLADEFDTIDSFNVHPSSRWETVYSASNAVLTVNNGILNYADEGDTYDYSYYKRDLQKDDFILEGRVKTPSGEILEREPLDETDMIFYNKIDEGTGTNLNDETVNNHDATMTDVSWSTDTFTNTYNTIYVSDYSVYFDNLNTTTSLSWGDHNDFTFGNYPVESDNPFSFSCWVKKNGSGNNVYLLGKDRAQFTSYLAEYSFYIAGSQVYFAIHDYSISAGACCVKYTTANPISNNVWYHLVCTYDGRAGDTAYQGMKIYINGVAVAQTGMRYTTGEHYICMENSLEPLFFGGYDSGTASIEVWIDETILYDTDLAIGDVWDLYVYYSESYDYVYADCVIGIEDRTVTLEPDYPQAGISFSWAGNDSCEVYYLLEYERTNFVNISTDTWYYFKMTVKIQTSYIKWELKTDSGNSISGSTKTNLDVDSGDPTIFASDKLDVIFGTYFYRNCSLEWNFDYISCPFGEYTFRQTNVQEDPDVTFLSRSAYGSQYNVEDDDIDFWEIFTLNVPKFDSCSGRITIDLLDEVDLAGWFTKYVYLGQYNPTTGVVSNVGGLELELMGGGMINLNIFEGQPHFIGDDTLIFSRMLADSEGEVSFTFYRQPNPNGLLILQCVFNEEKFTFNFDLPYNSSEISINTGDTLFHFAGTYSGNITTSLADFEFVRADLFGFIASAGVSLLGGILKLLLAPILISARFMAGTIAKVMKPIQDIIGDLLDPLFEIVEKLGELASSVASAILSIILSSIEEIIEALLPYWEIILEWVAGLIDDFIELIIDIISYVYTDILCSWIPWLDEFVTAIVSLAVTIIDTVQMIYAFVLVYHFALFLILTGFLFIATASRSSDFVEYFAEIVDVAKSNVLSGVSILGIAVAIPLGVIWLIYFLGLL